MTRSAYLIMSAWLFGAWLIIDSIYALVNGYYIGPRDPGIWAEFLRWIDVNPLSFAPGLLAIGISWIVAGDLLLRHNRWAKAYYVGTAVISLFYLPIGTFVALTGILVVMADWFRLPYRRRTVLGIATITALAASGALFYLVDNLST